MFLINNFKNDKFNKKVNAFQKSEIFIHFHLKLSIFVSILEFLWSRQPRNVYILYFQKSPSRKYSWKFGDTNIKSSWKTFIYIFLQKHPIVFFKIGIQWIGQNICHTFFYSETFLFIKFNNKFTIQKLLFMTYIHFWIKWTTMVKNMDMFIYG